MLALTVVALFATFVLALVPVVTFPFACVAALAGGIYAVPPRGGVRPRHYLLVGIAVVVATIWTILWQRAWS